jgi:hypothetical protein
MNTQHEAPQTGPNGPAGPQPWATSRDRGTTTDLFGPGPDSQDHSRDYRHAPTSSSSPREARHAEVPAQRPAPGQPSAVVEPAVQHRRTGDGDGTAMKVLRVITYVLASIASAIVITVSIYAGVKYLQITSTMNDLLGGTSPSTSGFSSAPAIDTATPAETTAAETDAASTTTTPQYGYQQPYSCTFAPDGVQVCEGQVPMDVGEYMTPEQYKATH